MAFFIEEEHHMTVLVLGATGATGKLAVSQLLLKGQKVRVIIRKGSKLPEHLSNQSQVEVIHANISSLSIDEMKKHLTGCHSVISCLGHNLTFKGIYGKPRRLVTDAISLVYQAVKQLQPSKPIKLLLMNSSGVQNKGLNEKISVANAAVVFLLRYLLPPHEDNEKASDFLETEIGKNNAFLDWVSIRPDSLTDSEYVSNYSAEPSPVRDAIFNAGKISRINVAHFMASLCVDAELWNSWRHRFPVLYGEES